MSPIGGMNETKQDRGGIKRRDWLLGATLVSGSAVVPVLAQDGFEQPPEAPPAPQPAPLAIQQTKLPNGLRIVVLPRPGATRTAIRLIGDGGWLRDPAGKEGLAEVALAMLAQGAKRDGELMESADIAYAGDLLGLPLRLELTPGGAELVLEALPDQCDDAVNLMADLTQRPTLAFESLEHMRSRAQDALVLRRADALLLAPWVARRAFWGRSQPVQTSASLKRLKREDVLAFHRQYWRPERTVLLFAGDLSLETARGLADDFMADWRVPKAPPPTTTPAVALASTTPPGATTPTAQFLQLPQGQGCRLIVQTAVPRGTPPVLRALARELMHQRLASRLPWPWDSEIESLGGTFCWRMSVTLPVSAVAEQLALLREQLPMIAAEAVSPEDLAMAQALALGDWQARLAEAPDELLARAIAAGELEDCQQWPQRVRAVSAPVLQLLMSASWRDNRTQLLLIGDAGPPEPAQRAWPGLSLATMRAVIGE
ncbi:M16 family metallopeptidase [Roseateles aquatilis]|nr:insulinase family protein [Roseateles aquatilis]